MSNLQTPYQRLGGEIVLRSLVNTFYQYMDKLPQARVIRSLHPDDLTSSDDKLFKFLSGWLGGPSLYEEEYGHPMLRARHLPFKIAQSERDAWMLCMKKALNDVFLENSVVDSLLFDHLISSLGKVADHMCNSK